MRKSILLLIAVLIFDVWYRAYTFAPTVVEATGLRAWPTATGPSEPLDCDEAIYAHMGRRILAGDVLYRDLTENKPPLGYWLYATPIALFGYSETAIRLFPIPYILATIAIVWWIGVSLSGPVAGGLAAFLYAILSTDPYLFGNGSNLEHLMNFFSVASLGLMVLGWDRGNAWPFALAGAALGAATLVKQVAVLPLAVYVAALAIRPTRDRIKAVGWLGLGLGFTLAAAAGVLLVQGAGTSAYDDIVRFGRAMATDVAPEPGAPTAWIRWLTGNADPQGTLPWPFGKTDYLVWWGRGSWPLWLMTPACLAHVAFAPTTSPKRRLVAGWTVAAIAEVVLPGMYWPHYYLLPTPGLALVLAITAGDSFAALGGRGRIVELAGAVAIVAATLGTTFLQVRDYLLRPPQDLTVRYKGGGQWVVLRALGKELGRRKGVFDDPRLYIWGWQSPLFFYGQLDGASRHLFTDNLLRDYADRDHPLITPRVAEIMADLRAKRPALIFAGYPPFPALRSFLFENYLPSRLVPSANGLGLWVAKDRYAAFENFDGPGTAGPLRELSGPARGGPGPGR
ncbi:ArnT family glycosyltransferase [Paludisphaera mucosa]|uniref:Glycosyltransferase family 39 protein n=1 Tax=Paludisphaera mucosa TaxID=3030827 RepID=A0ABT6FFM7_9BACT|nr:glycosyltransferase family 39 protein [Paludisphaera mucosa]MDG3006329.1 glycosyltransferase family 39 protein [Paludisphaera mucosa]